MTEIKKTKFYVVVSSSVPSALNCTEGAEDEASDNIQSGFPHKLHEVSSFGDTSSIEIDESVAFIAFLQSAEEGRKGQFDELYRDEAMIATIHFDDDDYLFVTPSGNYVRLPCSHDNVYAIIHPKTFNLSPYPIWEKALKQDITPKFLR